MITDSDNFTLNSNDLPLRDDYLFSVFPDLYNKPDVGDGKAKSTHAYSTARGMQGSISDLLSYVTKGIAVSGAKYHNNKRNKRNVLKLGVWLGDIDNKGDKQLTIEQCLAIPFVAKHCVIYTSPSHTTEHHRYRVILPLPIDIDGETYEYLGKYLNDKVFNGALDTAALESGRLFYGNSKAIVFNTSVSAISKQFLSEIQQELSAIKESAKAKKNDVKLNHKLLSSTTNKDYSTLKQKAIELVQLLPERQRGSGQYELLRNAVWGLCSLFDDHDYVKELLENSPASSDRSQGWDVSKLVDSYDSDRESPNGKITGYTFFYCLDQLIGTEYCNEIFSDHIPKYDQENYSQWVKDYKQQKCKELHSYTPDLTVNERYVTGILNTHYQHNRLLGIKAQKGCGKTYANKQFIKDNPQYNYLYLSCRRTLAFQASKVLGLGYIDRDISTAKSENFYYTNKGCSIVIDSLNKVKDIDFSNTIVIIDEANQVLNHAINAPTHIAKNRSVILSILSEILTQSKGIIAMDADLTDLTLSYFAKMSNKPIYAINNSYQTIKGNYYKYSSQKQVQQKVLDAIRDKVKFCFVSDSEREVTAMYELVKNTGNYLLFTADSMRDNPKLIEYLDDNGKLIRENKIDGIFYSPVMQSGISIEINGYFTHTFAVFYGVVLPDIARQMLRRVRDNTELHIYASIYGVKYRNQYDWEVIKGDTDFYTESLYDLIDYVNYICDGDKEKINDTLIEFLKGKNSPILECHNEFKAKLMALGNLLLSDFAECFYEELNNDGYTELVSNIDGVETDIVTDKKRDIYFIDAKNIRIAEDITEERAKELDKRDAVTTVEKNQLIKYKLLEFLPDFNLTNEFIAFYCLYNHRKIINGLHNLFLAENPDIAKKLDKKSLNHQVKLGVDSGFVLSSDIRSYSVIAKIYDELGIGEMRVNGTDSQSLKAFMVTCLKNKKLLSAVGITFGKTTKPKKILDKVLALYGLKTKSIGKSNDIRKYAITYMTPVSIDNTTKLDCNRTEYGLWKLSRCYVKDIQQAIARRYEITLDVETSSEMLATLLGESENDLKPIPDKDLTGGTNLVNPIEVKPVCPSAKTDTETESESILPHENETELSIAVESDPVTVQHDSDCDSDTLTEIRELFDYYKLLFKGNVERALNAIASMGIDTDRLVAV